jgi:hypothetical protein
MNTEVLIQRRRLADPTCVRFFFWARWGGGALGSGWVRGFGRVQVSLLLALTNVLLKANTLVAKPVGHLGAAQSTSTSAKTAEGERKERDG